MPISIDEFESHDPENAKTNAERVVQFLARNRDKAYKAIEIAEATGINENSIHPVLNRLKERELVRHREPYWTVGDLDVVSESLRFSSSVEFLEETLGPESREEWLRAAQADETDQE